MRPFALTSVRPSDYFFPPAASGTWRGRSRWPTRRTSSPARPSTPSACSRPSQRQSRRNRHSAAREPNAAAFALFFVFPFVLPGSASFFRLCTATLVSLSGRCEFSPRCTRPCIPDRGKSSFQGGFSLGTSLTAVFGPHSSIRVRSPRRIRQRFRKTAPTRLVKMWRPLIFCAGNEAENQR